MKREQIIEMARQANVYASHKTGGSNEWHKVRDEHFAALVAAAEREECAKIADKELDGIFFAERTAKAIRAMGETK
jgi:hypothetical protein